MSTTQRIMVFGPPELSKTKPIKFDDITMFFGDKTLSDHLANYDITIYLIGAFKYKYSEGHFRQPVLDQISSEAIRRENEVRSALERGRIVCFIGSHEQDYVFPGILKCYNIPFSEIYEGKIYRGLKTRRSEFKPFLDDVGATYIKFEKNAIDDIICTIEYDRVVGFSKQVGKGLLLFLPCVWGSDELNYVTNHLKILSRGLIAYSRRVILEPPSFLNDFQFTYERVVRGEIDRIKEEELTPRNKKLEHYNKLKSILWLGDDNLVKAVNDFLKDLGFQTEIDEIYEEDLWVVDNGKRQIIVEVKSKNKNLTRQDISKLDEHREARLEPNLTGLLIANTFMGANSMETKDQSFPPNVIEKAINTNVLITRTIDLCRIYDLLEHRGETRASETLLKIMIGQKGWLILQDDEIKIVS